MIYCFWDDIYINKWNGKVDDYYKFSNILIIDALKIGYSLSQIEERFRIFLSSVSSRKKDNKPIYRSDHLLAVQSIFGLIKLNKYREDQLCIVLKDKFPKSKKKLIKL